MASWQMRGVALYTRLVYRRKFGTEAAGHRTLARAKKSPAPPRALTRRFDVTCDSVQGFDVYRVRPGNGPGVPGDGHVVIYLHGGAYTSEIVSEHWALIGHIAARTGHEVLVPIYGLSPNHHGLQALDLVTAIIGDLARQGRRCYLAGDSAGGGLALLAAQAAASDRLAQPTAKAAASDAPAQPTTHAAASDAPATPAASDAPAQLTTHAAASDAPAQPAPPAAASGTVAGLTLIAPWLDLTMSNPGIDAIEPYDPWLARPGLRPLAAAWTGGLALDDPRLSPIYGDLDGLPPLQMLVGTRDITLADCRTLRDKLPTTVPLTYHEEPGALHVYPLLPVPEAKAGRQAIVEHIRATLG